MRTVGLWFVELVLSSYIAVSSKVNDLALSKGLSIYGWQAVLYSNWSVF